VDAKQINLTATPVRHGKSIVQYSDIFPKEYWFTMRNARQMLADKLWKKPIWHATDASLVEKTVLRFSGVRIGSDGDYDDTSQARVMIDLMDDHLATALPKLGDRSTLWFVANTEHGIELFDRLDKKGLKVAFISGDYKLTRCNVEAVPSNRVEIVKACGAGIVTHLITIQTTTTGFDCPKMSAGVWLRRTMSVGLFNQMAGRVLRKSDEPEAIMLDLAGNLGLHPFPEDIDWLDFNPSTKMFRDPKMVLCQSCGFRHNDIPRPIHHSDKKIQFMIGDGCFRDGSFPDLKTIIRCNHCNDPVFADFALLSEYGGWLKKVKEAGADKKTPPKHKNSSSGISIGKKESENQAEVSILDLYDLGIWNLSNEDGGLASDNRDRSDEYRAIAASQMKKFHRKEMRERRLNLLSFNQQDYIYSLNYSRIYQIQNTGDRYRTAIAYAYLNDKSLVWAYQFWRDEDKSSMNSELLKVFKSISNCPEAQSLLEEWLEFWIAEHDLKAEHNKKAVVESKLRLLKSLKVPSVA